MKRGIKSVFLTLMGLMFAASMAWAQQMEHHPAPGEQASPESNAESWQAPWMQQPLSPAQQQAISSVYEARVTQVYPLVMRIKAAQAQLVAELHAQTVNDNAVDQLVEQLADLRTELVRQQIDMFQQLKRQDVPVHMLTGLMRSMMGGMRGMGVAGQQGMGMGSGMDMMGGMHGMGKGSGMGMQGGMGGMRGGMKGGMMGGGMCRMRGGMHGMGMMGGMHGGGTHGGTVPPAHSGQQGQPSSGQPHH